jgi:hypothetical protein
MPEDRLRQYRRLTPKEVQETEKFSSRSRRPRSRASCTMRPVEIGSSKDAENPTADSAAHGIGENARCCLRACKPDLSNEHTAI